MDSFATDHDLMTRIGLQDVQAYRELVARHLAPSVRFAERMLASRADAEDIVQEAFFKVWQQASNWQPRAKFSTWLYRIIYNACIDHKRKVIRFASVEMEELADSALSATDHIIQNEEARSVKVALATLPERQRAAIVLSYYGELANQEAADILGVGLHAFQQLLFRGRAALRAQLIDKGRETANG